jgi:hypothetical protein
VTSWTFSAFTDPDGRIASYSATLVTVTGSGSLSGSGLGAYSITGTADGDAYTVELDALDGDGGVLATAVHTVAIAGGAATFTAPLFDGVDDNLWAPFTTPLAARDPFTVSFWFLVDPSHSATSAMFAIEGTANWQLFVSSSFSVARSLYGTSGGISAFAGFRWHHLMYVQTGTRQRYYWEGRLTKDDSAGLASTTPVRFVIGDNQQATSIPFVGAIRDVGIWSSDQSGQLAQIIANGPGAMLSSLATPPDLAYWPLDGQGDTFNNGETIVDQTGNGYDLTVRNMTGSIGTYTAKGYNP